MKTLYLFLCSFLILTTLQCQNEEVFKESPLTGTWVDNSTKADTLEFLSEYDGQNPIFWLKRGKNSDSLPKEYSGPYWYEFSKKSISINWFLSSNSEYKSYYFMLSPDKKILKMGNFYNNLYDSKDTLVFRLLK